MKKGWKLVEETNHTIVDEEDNNASKSNRNRQLVSTPLTEEHLEQLGYDLRYITGRRALRDDFKTGNRTPDDVWFHKDLCIGGCRQSPPFVSNVRLVMMEPSVFNQRSSIDESELIFSDNAINMSSVANTHTSSYKIKETHKTAWKTTSISLLKIYGKVSFSIPLIASKKFHVEISTGVNVENGGEKIIERESSGSRTYQVPPKSSVEFKVFLVKEKINANYVIPITFQGPVLPRFNSYKPYGDSRFAHISYYPNFTKRINNLRRERGTLEVFEAVNTRSYVSPSKPL